MRNVPSLAPPPLIGLSLYVSFSLLYSKHSYTRFQKSNLASARYFLGLERSCSFKLACGLFAKRGLPSLRGWHSDMGCSGDLGPKWPCVFLPFPASQSVQSALTSVLFSLFVSLFPPKKNRTYCGVLSGYSVSCCRFFQGYSGRAPLLVLLWRGLRILIYSKATHSNSCCLRWAVTGQKGPHKTPLCTSIPRFISLSQSLLPPYRTKKCRVLSVL